MLKSIKILISVFTFLIIFSLIGCNNDNNTNDQINNNDNIEESLGVLRIGLMPSLDAFPIVIAHHFGYFEDERLSVVLEPFSGAGYRDAALQAGLLDASTFDLVAVGLSREANIVPMRVTGSTTGRFTLVARDDFNSIEDLAGEVVVISQNTAIDLVLDQMVYLAGFDADHLETVAIQSIPSRLEYLRAGNVNAALLPEPWATIILAEEGFHAITNTLEIGFIPFVTAFTEDFIENNPEAIRAFYRAYNRGIDFLNNHELEDFIHIMIDVINFSDAIADILELPVFAHNQLPEEFVLDSALEWLKNRNLISAHFTIQDFISNVAFE